MTTPGLGAASIMGVAPEVLPPPVLAGAPAAGGALTAGTYKYYLTAIGPQGGETTVSNEITVTTAAGNLTAALTWAAVTGATGYKVYRTAAAGASNSELLLATLGVVLLYNDAAVGAPAGAFPNINTASNPGVYVAPTKFIPYLSESLKFTQQTNWRRPIRNTPGLVGASPGFSNAEGDLSIEALTDCIIYFLSASRCTYTKVVAAQNTYVFTPSAVAVPARTLSITIIRNGVVYGYVGCTVGSFKFEVNNAVLQFSPTIVSTNETVQSAPTATWPTTVPFGAGQYNLQIPTSTQIFDSDGFTFESNDNGAAQFRLISANTGAQFVSFGESEASISITRDFFNRAEYDAFKVLTAKSITLTATHSAPVESIALVSPTSIVDTYEVNIGGQGDLVRASVTYQCAIDGTGKHYQITVVTAENMS